MVKRAAKDKIGSAKGGELGKLRNDLCPAEGEDYKGEGFEVAYWSQKVAASPQQIKDGLVAAGDFTKAVKGYLNKRK